MVRARNIRLTSHAVNRYRERLQRPQDFADARDELVRLLRCGSFSNDPPDWLQKVDPTVSGYWLMGDVCLVLQRRVVAVTCVTRGSISPERRRRRNERRQSRRYRLAKERGR